VRITSCREKKRLALFLIEMLYRFDHLYRQRSSNADKQEYR